MQFEAPNVPFRHVSPKCCPAVWENTNDDGIWVLSGAVKFQPRRANAVWACTYSRTMAKMPEQLTDAALHVGFAMQMACTLPRYTDDSAFPGEVRVACLESYLSNMRTLIDFLVRRRDPRDIHRHDYLPGWEPAHTGTVKRLEELWMDVSQTVSHLSWQRVPELGKPFAVLNVAPPNLQLLAILVLDLAEEFTADLEAEDHPNRVQFRAAVDLCQARLTS